jgi:glutamate synthase domain-containing protein 2
MGADAVSLGQGVLIALGCNSPHYLDKNKARVDVTDDYEKLDTAPGFCHHCQSGKCPVGITTQDDDLQMRLQVEEGTRRLRNYLNVLTLELTTLARACGKSNVHNLEREDLVALTVEAAAMAKLPLAGTDWIPGHGKQDSPGR